MSRDKKVGIDRFNGRAPISYTGDFSLHIETKLLRESKEYLKVLEETVFNYTKVFDPDHEFLVSGGFELRKNLTQSLLDYFGISDELIYLEYENHSIQGNLEVFKTPDGRAMREIKDLIESQSFYSHGLTMVDFERNITKGLNTINADIPEDLGHKIMIVYYPKQPSDRDYKNPLWTLVHESMHNIGFLSGGDGRDEIKTQKATFEFLLEYGYSNAIGIEMLTQVEQKYIGRNKGWLSEYYILEYMLKRLTTEDPNLLLSLIEALSEAMDGTISDRLREAIEDDIIEILARFDFDVSELDDTPPELEDGSIYL